jgi:hypothetical protein
LKLRNKRKSCVAALAAKQYSVGIQTGIGPESALAFRSSHTAVSVAVN